MGNNVVKSPTKIRDRENTERRLLDAAISIIRTDGLDSVGISSVAKEAGVSKVLIYRYFGGLEGLLEKVGEELDPASIRGVSSLVDEGLNLNVPIPDLLRDIVLKMREKLLADEFSLNLMAWEMLNENDLTRAFSHAREEAGIALNHRLSQEMKDGKLFDVDAALAVVSSSIYYLILRSRFVEQYNGIDLRSDAGWERLADILAKMIGGLMT